MKPEASEVLTLGGTSRKQISGALNFERSQKMIEQLWHFVAYQRITCSTGMGAVLHAAALGLA